MKSLIFIIVLLVASISFTSIRNHNEDVAMKQKVLVKENIESIKQLPIKPVERITVKVTVTMYNATTGQCDSSPLITADNSRINPKKASEHKWIAMSRDMLKRWGGRFNYGDRVRITGTKHKDGVYEVRDTMNKRYTKRIDILETLGTKMYKFPTEEYPEIIIEKVS